MIEPTKEQFQTEMTGARRNEMLRAAKSKAEKRAIHLAYEERQSRLRLAQAQTLLNKLESSGEIANVNDCSIQEVKCKVLSYRKGTNKIHQRLRAGIEVLGHPRRLSK
jgi:hypothetical protein